MIDDLTKRLEDAMKPDTGFRTTPLERVLPLLKEMIETLKGIDARVADLERRTAPVKDRKKRKRARRQRVDHGPHSAT